MGKDPREDFDALFQGKTDSTSPKGVFDYWNPALHCKCTLPIWLPYGSLPQMDEEATPLEDSDLLELPSETWSRIFGCIRCGRIATYTGDQVEAARVLKRSASLFHSHADVWLVVLQCGEKHCAALHSVHLDMREYHATPNTADATDAVAALRSGMFDGQMLPCGHTLKTIPRELYHATRVTSRMW